MALDPVPWAVGNGAENSVEGARRALYDSTGGARGVTNPEDMEVTALPVPGGAVRVHTGSCKSPNDYPGGGAQSYSGWEASSTDVPVPATGSSGGAVRWLLWRVDDPQYSGQPPADPTVGPYNRYVWVGSNPFTNPPAYPHVPLVRLNQPANTQTITNAMLTDVRELANPKTEILSFGRPRVPADSPDDYPGRATLTVRNNDGGEYFPGGNGSPNTFQYDMPEWATRVMISALWTGVKYGAGQNVAGYYWVEFGDEYRNKTWPGNRQWERATQKFAFNGADSDRAEREVWQFMDAVPVPKHLRGKRLTFAFKAGLTQLSDTGVEMDEWGGLGMTLMVTQKAVDIHTVSM